MAPADCSIGALLSAVSGATVTTQPAERGAQPGHRHRYSPFHHGAGELPPPSVSAFPAPELSGTLTIGSGTLPMAVTGSAHSCRDRHRWAAGGHRRRSGRRVVSGLLHQRPNAIGPKPGGRRQASYATRLTVQEGDTKPATGTATISCATPNCNINVSITYRTLDGGAWASLSPSGGTVTPALRSRSRSARTGAN